MRGIGSLEQRIVYDKVCTRCARLLPLSAYQRDRDKQRSECRECNKRAQTEARRARGATPRTRRTQTERYRSRRSDHRRRIWQHLHRNPCVDCGNADPRVLEFDHREPEQKVVAISQMPGHYAWEAIAKEITKCDVRCANCHRIRTYEQRGYEVPNGA